MINDFITYQDKIFEALYETFIMVSISMGIAAFLGIPFGTLMALSNKQQIYENKVFYVTFNTIINTLRSIPFVLLIIILIPLTRLIVNTSYGTMAATVPLSFIAFATLARAVEQTLTDVDYTVIESALAMGAKKHQIVWHFIFVEARSGLVLAFTSTLISVISFSAILGIVSGGGIGDFAIYYGYQRNQFGLMIVVIILLIIIVQIIQWIGSLIALLLNKRRKIS